MSCQDQIGVKNISISFTDCDSGNEAGPYAHVLSDDGALPEIVACTAKNTELTDGKVKRARTNAGINISVQPLRSVPLAFYQGCASIDIQLEYYDGTVITGKDGNVIDAGGSTYEKADMNIRFKEIDEMRPQTARAA